MSFLASASLLLVVAAAEMPPISREEAAACLRDRQGVDARNAALSTESQRLAQRASEIEQAERELEQVRDKVDADRVALTALKAQAQENGTLDEQLKALTGFSMAKDAFDAQVARYNERVRAQQARREPYNRDARQLNADIAVLDAQAKGLDARCAGRRIAP
ncbi:MAG TPA: hypothetical protein VM074_01780 [Solimonas sp.]|nr:hypothetical protein [Solimonas sp.]